MKIPAKILTGIFLFNIYIVFHFILLIHSFFSCGTGFCLRQS